MNDVLRAPFPYFGGKRQVTDVVWRAFGQPKQYIEPFCGSAAMLLAAPSPATLEVVGDASGFIANFWRATKCQPAAVALAADYPISHLDLGARHAWLMDQRERVGGALQDPEWHGDAQVAGWWLWGQCAWIGSGWCEWDKAIGQIPHVSSGGRGVLAIGKIPHVTDAGRGVLAIGQIPHISDGGQGIGRLAPPQASPCADLWTSAGRTAWVWLHKLAERLERVRVIHGDWNRCLNSHYGGTNTAIFFDPPYNAYEKLYGTGEKLVASEVEAWCRDHADLRLALCGHRGDYDLPGWTEHEWSRGQTTYGGTKTTAEECIWFSPACCPLNQEGPRQLSLFDSAA